MFLFFNSINLDISYTDYHIEIFYAQHLENFAQFLHEKMLIDSVRDNPSVLSNNLLAQCNPKTKF